MTSNEPPVAWKFSIEDLQRPVINEAEAQAIVAREWGLHVVGVNELGSYEDRNFMVKCGPTGTNDATADGAAAAAAPQQQQQRYVLKVHNSVFSQIPGFLESQNAVGLHLASKGIKAAVAQPTAADSRLIISRALPTGMSKMRLLSFIPGCTLKAARKTPQLLRSVGRQLATVDVALGDFSHPGTRPSHDWAISHAMDALQQFGHHLQKYQDTSIRAAAETVRGWFEQLVLPAAAAGQLRVQLIHHDANENNIILHEEEVVLIDWSDMAHAWLVTEPAVAVAYMLLMTVSEAAAAGLDEAAAAEQALQAAAHLLAGYTQALALTELEWRLLPVLAAARLLQSTVIGLETISKEPGNAEYVMPDEAERWSCIKLLLSCTPDAMAARLKVAAQASAAAAAAAASDGSRCRLPARLPPFKLELYLAQHEDLPLQLSRSSCQPLELQQLLGMADSQLAAQWQQLVLGYPPNKGSLQFREEVVRCYAASDPSLLPEHVLSCVPNEGIFITITALLAPGDTVVVMHPVYQTLLEVARALGATVKLWSMEIEPQTGRPFFSIDALRQLMTADVKCLVVNLPHNPSGWLPSHQEWEQIVQCAAEAGSWLFADEVYRLLEPHPDRQRLAPAAWCYPGRGISLAGLSKAHGLQGLRCGWLVCHNTELLAQAERVKSYITTTGSITSELLGLIGLRNQQRLVDRCRGIIADNTLAATEFFFRWPEVFQWTPPDAGSLCLPRLTTGEDIEAFAARAVEGCGVVLLPATVYDHTAASAGQHFRLGLGRTNFRQALAALEVWLQQQQQQQQQAP